MTSWSAPRLALSSSSSFSSSTPLGSPEDQIAAALFAGLPWAIARARRSASSLASESNTIAAGAASAASISFLKAHADAAEGITGLEKLGASLRRVAEAPSSEAAAGAALREAVEGLVGGGRGGGSGSKLLGQRCCCRRRRSEVLRLCGVTLSSPSATLEHRKAALRMLTAVLRLEAAATAAAASSSSSRLASEATIDDDNDATVALSAAVASLGGNLGDEGLAALRAALAVSVRVSRADGKDEEEEENALPLEQQRQRKPPSTSAERAALAVDALARVACAWPTTMTRPLLISR